MAGDWIKWTKGLTSRREVVILASALQRDRHEIAGRLMVLWEWCDENTTDADAEEMSPHVSLILGDRPFDFLDALLGLPGMAEAMASPGVRWLEARSGGRIVFPNLARHNGTSAKTRAYEATKKRRQRECMSSLSPKMSPTSGDKTGTREEKRRVLEENPLPPSAADPPKPTKKAKPPPADSPPFPPELNTPAFVAAWERWLAYRREAKHKPYLATGAAGQFKRLAEWGEQRAVAAIDYSIAQQWQGIYEDRSSKGLHDNGPNSRPTQPHSGHRLAAPPAGTYGRPAGSVVSTRPTDANPVGQARPSAGQPAGSSDAPRSDSAAGVW